MLHSLPKHTIFSMGDARRTAPHGRPIVVFRKAMFCPVSLRRVTRMTGRRVEAEAARIEKSSSGATFVARSRCQKALISNSNDLLASPRTKHVQQRDRVYSGSVDPHGPVKVRTRGAAGCAYRADDVAGLDHVICMDVDLRQMCEE